MTAADVAIRCDALTRSFPSGVAVDHLSFELPAGEVLALLGPNGAGKTTTVRLLNGVLIPDTGTSSVLGLDPATDGHLVRQRTGVLTENAGLDDRLTARENLLATARLRGWRDPAAGARADDLLERFGMGPRANDQTQGFSTGQRKRIALARALLGEPELLFLDEPTAGLDPTATRDVADLIRTLTDEQGRTVVLATHFLAEAGALADRMAVLDHGRLLAFGRPDELAHDLWQGMEATIDVGRPADGPTIAALRELGGVLEASPTSSGAVLRIADRAVLPRIVELLGDRDLPVYGVESHKPTLEDVYYELEQRATAADEPRITSAAAGVHAPVTP